MTQKTIVLAYSGGLDTSTILPWLRDQYGDVKIIAYCLDMGNSPKPDEIGPWAKKLGADEFIFEDQRDHFARDFVFPLIRAGGTYEGEYLLGTAIARPLIAERIAYFAKKYGAWAVAHGATGKGNDQLRFEHAWAYLIPEVKVIAPWKIWDFKGRGDLRDYMRSKGFSMDEKKRRYSEDVNLMHRSVEGGILEEIGSDYDPDEVNEWVMTNPDKRSNKQVDIKLDFVDGFAVALNDKPMSPAAILTELNTIAGKLGIGVADLVENRIIGLKNRGIYETPGGTVLHMATRQLKGMCWDRPLAMLARFLGDQYGGMVYDGFWFSDARQSLEAFFQHAGKLLTGTVAMHLSPGVVRITHRSSPFSLYSRQAISFESDELDLNTAALGYCKLAGLNQWNAGQRDMRLQRRKTGEAA